MPGFSQWPSPVRPQAQVLRNQSVGKRSIWASSSARFVTPMRMATSLGEALAYSTVTSKYRFSWKTPVSASSNSGSALLRRRFSSTSQA